MKEVTYEEWQKNPIPRMMWCWDEYEIKAVKRMVLYLFPEDKFNHNVIALDSPDSNTCNTYRHCAEIEEPKTRRMTNKELSRWLSEKPHRERKYERGPYIYTYHTYDEYEQDKEVPDSILIREDDGAWHLPLVEVKE